ncbi:MAG: site-2 protease family protein [Anaerolineae bacterium]
MFEIPSLLAKLVILLIGFPIHEFVHAYVAYRLGDDTAARQGRLTLNPLAHLDPVGSLLLLFSFIGWAKPVPVNPWRLRFGPRVGHALVAAAGPASNLLMAALVAIPWRLGWLGGMPMFARQFFWMFVAVNVALFLFNLIPLAPLDGNSVLRGVVGARAAQALQPLEAYGPLILLGLFILGYISPALNILGTGLSLAIGAIMRVLIGY